MTTTKENDGKYGVIFDAALSMSRLCNDTADDIGRAMSKTLFAICNGWERDPDHFPPAVLDSAFDVAVAWEQADFEENGLNNEQRE